MHFDNEQCLRAIGSGKPFLGQARGTDKPSSGLKLDLWYGYKTVGARDWEVVI